MVNKITRRTALRGLGWGCLGLLTERGFAQQQTAEADSGATVGGRWFRGNLHMHTYWSDGRIFPDQAIDIYKRLGYDFIGLSEHNVFAGAPACWRSVEEKEGTWPPEVTTPLFDAYLKDFGSEVETRQAGAKKEVRLKSYAELQRRFNEPGKFMLLPAVEITQVLNGVNVHLNYLNLPEVIPFVKGGAMCKQIKDASLSVSALIRQNADEVAALSAQLRQPTVLTLNHPQWVYWDILPQNLIDNPAIRFFEVCNGGSAFAPHPGAQRLNNDTFWDAVNAFRAIQGQPLLYGIGTDDTHMYLNRTPAQRLADAWVMVRSEALSPDALLAAMHAGDFYATCGVMLDDVTFSPAARTLRVRVKAAPGVKYTVRFITTKKGFDQAVRTVESPAEKGRGARALPVYSDDIGKTVQTVTGSDASYRMAPDDLYVRARVESDTPVGFKHHFHPETCVAWTQPYGGA